MTTVTGHIPFTKCHTEVFTKCSTSFSSSLVEIYNLSIMTLMKILNFPASLPNQSLSGLVYNWMTSEWVIGWLHVHSRAKPLPNWRKMYLVFISVISVDGTLTLLDTLSCIKYTAQTWWTEMMKSVNKSQLIYKVKTHFLVSMGCQIHWCAYRISVQW